MIEYIYTADNIITKIETTNIFMIIIVLDGHFSQLLFNFEYF